MLKDRISVVSLELSCLADFLATNPTNSQVHEERVEAKVKLLQLQAREEEDRRQRLRVDWLWLGYSNSSFFSKMMKKRALRNSQLCNINAHVQSMITREELTNEGIGFYSELFKAKDMIEGTQCFPRLVFNDMNMWLFCLLLEEEFFGIASSLTLDKSLGPDEFIKGFFKHF